MSYQTTNLLPCQDIQGRLEDLWKTPAFPGADDKMPFSDMLNSQINRFPIQRNYLYILDCLQNDMDISYL
jgi:hypothetical protein